MSVSGSGPDERAWGVGDNRFVSTEVYLVVLLAVAIALGSYCLLNLADRYTGYLFADFRTWTPSASLHQPSEQFADLTYQSFFRRLQPEPDLRRSLRLVLEFQGEPEPGRYVAAEGKVRVDPEARYCFEVMSWSPYENRESSAAVEMFSVLILIDGRVVAEMPIADHARPRWVLVRDIEPVGEDVEVRFEVRSHSYRTGSSWRRASRVVFEFARLHPCFQTGDAA